MLVITLGIALATNSKMSECGIHADERKAPKDSQVLFLWSLHRKNPGRKKKARPWGVLAGTSPCMCKDQGEGG